MEIETEKYEFLMSSPAKFVGSVDNEISHISLHHAFGNIYNYEKDYPDTDDSYHLLKFDMPAQADIKPGMIVPNYYPVGEIISQVMTVLFGKLVIPLGLSRSKDTYCVPDYVDLSLYREDLPFYSSKVRFEFPIVLNRAIMKNFYLDKLDETFIDASKIYQNALIDYPKDTSIAYMSLVGAGEIITKRMKFEDSEVFDQDVLELLSEIKENLKDGKKKAGFLKGKMRQIKKRYTMGLMKYFNERIVSTEQGLHNKLTEGNLKNALEASYDLRSQFLHNGLRIGKHTRFPQLEVGLPYSPSYSNELKKILKHAPNFNALERLIRFSLLKRLFDLYGVDFYVPTVEHPFLFG